MKRNIIVLISASLILPVFAQEELYWGNVPVMSDSYGHYITRDGSYAIGEAVSLQSCWGRDMTTGEIDLFEACTLGYGNSVSKDHRVVGIDDVEQQAAFLIGGQDPEIIAPMAKYSGSSAYGITWDGTRLVGIVANKDFPGFDETDPEKMRMEWLPVYCDIDPVSGVVGEVVILPTPERDFMGLVPQYCTAMWISDDGKTILGQVIAQDGVFIYPIVYLQDENGKWSYTLPSQSLFNPENLAIPQYPPFEMEPPQAEYYIKNPENLEKFVEMLQAWNNNTSSLDPYDYLDPSVVGPANALMTQEEFNEYQVALREYNQYTAQHEALLDKYYEELSVFYAHNTLFLQTSMAMNPQGTLISQTKTMSYKFGETIVNQQIPVLFNLTTGEIKEIPNDNNWMQIMQILPDGNLICATPLPNSAYAPDATPQHTYVYPADGSGYITIQDFLKPQNPTVYEWMDEYLHQEVPIGFDDRGAFVYKDMVVSGLVAVSDDFSALCGGVDTWSWDFETGDDIAYFITGLTTPEAGIEDLVAQPKDGEYNVYNLQGVKILSSKDADSLNSLQKGLYIINGKKVVL